MALFVRRRMLPQCHKDAQRSIGKAFVCRQDEEVLSQFCKLAALVIQRATVQLKLQRQPSLLPEVTTDLTVPQALRAAAAATTTVCPAEAVRLIFQLPATVRCLPGGAREGVSHYLLQFL